MKHANHSGPATVEIPAPHASSPLQSDQEERAALAAGMSRPGGLTHSVVSAQVKRMPLGTFYNLTGLGSPSLPWLQSSSFVYVALASGSFGFPGDPASSHPWLLNVYNANAPYQLVLTTAGDPGSDPVPSWFANAPDVGTS